MDAIPRLNRDSILFVFIDLQTKLLDKIQRAPEVISGAAMLLKAAGILHIPALVTSQYRKGLGDVAPEIRELWTGEIPDKTAFSCGADERIRTEIEQHGRDVIVLAGVETHICVLQTALDLLRSGKQVAVVANVVASRKDRDHELGLHRMEQSGALIVTREMVVYELLGRAGTDEFKQVLQLIK